MKFTLTISSENEAFDGDPVPELVRLLQAAQEKLQEGQTTARCLDINGNRVGGWFLDV